MIEQECRFLCVIKAGLSEGLRSGAGGSVEGATSTWRRDMDGEGQLCRVLKWERAWHGASLVAQQ